MKGLSSILGAGGYLKEIKLPYSLFLLKGLVKSTINFLHLLILFFLYLVIFHKDFSLTLFLVFPGIILLVITLFFWCLAGAILVLYFRDFLQIAPRILSGLFLLTPIIWQNKIVGPKYQIFLELNPMTALVNIVREPLLGVTPSLHEVLLAITTTIIGFIVSLIAYQFTKNKLIFLV